MKNWYCVQIKPKQERGVKIHLIGQSYECYLPMTLVDKRTKRQPRLRPKAKREYENQPLFPGYIFIHMTEGQDDFHPVKKLPGVLRIVQFGASPAIVPDDLIAALRAQEDSKGLHSQHKVEFAPGDKVRVTSGPFQHIETVIESLHKLNGEERGVVLMDMLGTRRRVPINLDQLEAVA